MQDRDIAVRLRSPDIKSDNQLFKHILYNVVPRVEAVLIQYHSAKPQDAEDATANGLNRLWEGAISSESLYTYTPDGASFQTWFAVVSLNELRRIWSASGRPAPLNGDVIDDRSDDTTGEGAEHRAAEHAEAVKQVAKIREELIPKDRLIVDGYLESDGGEGPWATNLSKKMGDGEAMTANYIRVRFHRILDRLRNNFIKNSPDRKSTLKGSSCGVGAKEPTEAARPGVAKRSSHSSTDQGP